MQTKLFLSPVEVAVELSISPSTVLRLIHDDRLPAIKVSDRIYRIPVAAFEKYKAGSLEAPFVAPVSGATRPRPRIGAGEVIPEAIDRSARVRTA
jgi:excisionase family DNA binding protein